MKCNFCGKARVYHKKKSVREKYRICESGKAKAFLDQNKALNDDISVQHSHLTCEGDVFAADVYYHNVCFLKRKSQYNAAVKSSTTNNKSKKFMIFSKFMEESIISNVDKGHSYKISEIANSITNSCADNEIIFRSNEIKRYVTDEFSTALKIYCNPNHNEGDFIFSAKLTDSEVAAKMKQNNLIEEVGRVLKKVIKSVDFALDDTFCDADTIKSSWHSVQMPEEWLVFYSALHKIPKTKLIHHETLRRVALCRCRGGFCYTKFGNHNMLWCQLH